MVADGKHCWQADCDNQKGCQQGLPLRGFVLCDDCGVPYRGGCSTGRHRSYAYYNCLTKGCDSYGKSIKKDVMDSHFEALLKTLRPSGHLFNTASRMFEAPWKKYLTAFGQQRHGLADQLGKLEKRIEKLVTRLVKANQPAVTRA